MSGWVMAHLHRDAASGSAALDYFGVGFFNEVDAGGAGLARLLWRGPLHSLAFERWAGYISDCQLLN